MWQRLWVKLLSKIKPVITDLRMWVMGICFYNLMTLYFLLRLLQVNFVSKVYNGSIVKEFNGSIVKEFVMVYRLDNIACLIFAVFYFSFFRERKVNKRKNIFFGI